MRYIYIATCKNHECPVFNEETRLVDAGDKTLCGGCYTYSTPVKTEEEWE